MNNVTIKLFDNALKSIKLDSSIQSTMLDMVRAKDNWFYPFTVLSAVQSFPNSNHTTELQACRTWLESLRHNAQMTNSEICLLMAKIEGFKGTIGAYNPIEDDEVCKQLAAKYNIVIRTTGRVNMQTDSHEFVYSASIQGTMFAYNTNLNTAICRVIIRHMDKDADLSFLDM